MTRAWLVAVLVIAACGGKSAPPPVAPECPVGPRMLTSEELDDIRKRAAGCPDQACRDAVNAEFENTAITIAEMQRFAAKMEGQIGVALEELRVLDAAACRCTTADCVYAVQRDFEEWAKRHAEAGGTQADADAATEIAEHMSECMAKATSGGTP